MPQCSIAGDANGAIGFFSGKQSPNTKKKDDSKGTFLAKEVLFGGLDEE